MRCVRLYTGPDERSHVEEIELPLGARLVTAGAHFEETPAGASLDWHTAPAAQYVVTLSGTLEFVTRDGESFLLRPGDVLLAEDTTGTGHRWRLVDDQPWRRLYVELAAPAGGAASGG
jgi:quercetin dioxygenase-like cupin family protein